MRVRIPKDFCFGATRGGLQLIRRFILYSEVGYNWSVRGFGKRLRTRLRRRPTPSVAGAFLVGFGKRLRPCLRAISKSSHTARDRPSRVACITHDPRTLPTSAGTRCTTTCTSSEPTGHAPGDEGVGDELHVLSGRRLPCGGCHATRSQCAYSKANAHVSSRSAGVWQATPLYHRAVEHGGLGSCCRT